LKNDPKVSKKKKGEKDKEAVKSILDSEMLEITKEGYLPHQLPMPTLKRGQITNITVHLVPDPSFQAKSANANGG
jgi:hypothetical protein